MGLEGRIADRRDRQGGAALGETGDVVALREFDDEVVGRAGDRDRLETAVRDPCPVEHQRARVGAGRERLHALPLTVGHERVEATRATVDRAREHARAA